MALELTVERLIEEYTGRLALRWIGGHSGRQRVISGADSEEQATSVAGHLNLIRPYRVQIIGHPEVQYIESLEQAAEEHITDKLFQDAHACVIVTEGLELSASFIEASNTAAIPLLGSTLSCQQMVEEVHFLLTRYLARRVTVDGVFLEVMGVGVLLTGKAGVGKSELALELVSRGHRLVADDSPEFSLVGPDTLVGSCPEAITDFMEVRGLGIVNIRALFGDSAVMRRRYLRLVINLEPQARNDISPESRLAGIHTEREIMEVKVPQVTLPMAAGHNLAVLVECTVRNHILRMKGYDAAQDLENKLQQVMKRQEQQ